MKTFQDFEKCLDLYFSKLKIFEYDANETLALVCNIQETAAAEIQTFPLSRAISHGISILAPFLVSEKRGSTPDSKTVISDLMFCIQYYSLRELIYYSYNAPGSVEWVFEAAQVQIRYADSTLPRQFYTVWNDYIELSRQSFANSSYVGSARRLLTGEIEGSLTKNVKLASRYIDKEINQKIKSYFSILDEGDGVIFGEYSYAEFLVVYKFILGNSLYHRRFGEANNAIGCIFIDYEQLVSQIKDVSGLPDAKIINVLDDIIFDKRISKEKLDASYFSLLREGSGKRRIIMRPVDFSMSEGLVNILRVVASRRPDNFLRNVSGKLGSKFANRVAGGFTSAGFHCLADIKLTKLDPLLPDIDLLVICEEPTLGYVLFVCELKGTIPPKWAKDQLKALREDGVSKAFRQSEAVQRFLRTPDGVQAMNSWISRVKPPLFESFIVVVEPLIVTSDNSGMFFSKEETPIINFRTLERLLKASDGDTAFVQHVIHTYNAEADKALKLVTATANVGGIKVEYEGVSESPIMRFPQQSWRQSKRRRKMIDAFLADGAHPFDSIGVDAKSTPPGTIIIAYKGQSADLGSDIDPASAEAE